MICQTIVDPDTGEVLGVAQVEEPLDEAGMALMAALIRAGMRAFTLPEAERRAELRRLTEPGS